MKRKQKNTNSFLIGLFVMIGSLILIIMIIWLGASQILKEQTYYVTYFESSVEGLETGSAVKYQGVPCGRITNLKVAPDGKLVEVIFQIDKSISIDDSLRVQPAMAGIAGGKFLQLHYPTNLEMAEMYPHLSFEPPYKLIKSAPSGLEEITIAAEKVMNNLMGLNGYEINRNTIAFLQSSTNFFTSKELMSIMENLKSSTKHLNSVLEKMDSSNTIDNLNKTSQKIKNTAAKLESTVNSLNTQIVQMQLDTYVHKFYDKYDSTLERSTNMIGNVALRAESSIFSLNELLEQLNRTNSDLQNALRVLNDNPSTIFFSSPPPKEK